MELLGYDGELAQRARSSREDVPRVISLAEIGEIAARIMAVGLDPGFMVRKIPATV